MQSHDKLLQSFLELHLPGTRVRVDDSLSHGEIKISRGRVVLISPSYVSPSTDLAKLALRVRRLVVSFEEREEKERQKHVKELEQVITHRFERLIKLDPVLASTLLFTLRNTLDQSRG